MIRVMGTLTVLIISLIIWSKIFMAMYVFHVLQIVITQVRVTSILVIFENKPMFQPVQALQSWEIINDSTYSINLETHVNSPCQHASRVEQVEPHHHCSNNTNTNVNPLHSSGTHWCTVNFMNTYYHNTGTNTLTHIVFISNGNNIHTFFNWNVNLANYTVTITECSDVGVGYLYHTISFAMFITFYEYQNSDLDPKSCYRDYEKDILSRKLGFKSYTEYMQDKIDMIIQQQEPTSSTADDGLYTVRDVVGPCVDSRPFVIPRHLSELSDAIISDFNDTQKTKGFLAKTSTDFQFCGPDREPKATYTLEDYICMAKAIRSTRLPNYKFARFPVPSSLNLDAWRHHLKDYHDQRLLQYLTYGFPLSINNPSNLHNTDVKNHHSAMQFPAAIQQYLTKEVQLGAMLGPFPLIDYDDFHCSPLLTRPKDGNKRRVILDLSYPRGASVNDAVTRDRFDDLEFTLTFPTIDNIVDQIKATQGRVLLAKIDVARAFRNLRVDPADAFKFGLKWGGGLLSGRSGRVRLDPWELDLPDDVRLNCTYHGQGQLQDFCLH